jgi:hypothetical protein
VRKERESEQNRDGPVESEEFESEMGESGIEVCSTTRAANLTGLPAGRRQGEYKEGRRPREGRLTWGDQDGAD